MESPIVSPEQEQMSVDKVLGKFSEWYRIMKEAGLRFKDLQLPIDNVDFRARLVRFWKSCGEQEVSTVDQVNSLKAMISAGNFDYVNPNITEANFPDIGAKTDFKVYDFKKTVSSDHAVAEMAKEGYRPANLRELLNWMSANWNGKDWVVALGQFWRDSYGDRDVPYLYFGSGRGLLLHFLGDDWRSGYRFLAVRNS